MYIAPKVEDYEKIFLNIVADINTSVRCMGQCSGCVCQCRCSCKATETIINW